MRPRITNPRNAIVYRPRIAFLKRKTRYKIRKGNIIRVIPIETPCLLTNHADSIPTSSNGIKKPGEPRRPEPVLCSNG
ncbi:MAG: hypothetical protein JNL22_01130 [Bacteroidales bacterium]|nr:hypothetical protein [Bacteroidales bacterium]